MKFGSNFDKEKEFLNGKDLRLKSHLDSYFESFRESFDTEQDQ
ncbi:MAG: hypothetical protein BAJALOKI2v1_140043 [Promethearchaeota archaeon]|nr:MAG: hypothetical protein BAJALOKI2v1_140043 [Candidatus Lokiarchaeota archaeon]